MENFGKMKEKCLSLIEAIIYFLACISIPTLSGVFFYFIQGLIIKEGEPNIKIVYFSAGVGVFVWVLYLFLRSGCAKLFLKENHQEDREFLSKMDQYSKECYCKVKKIYYCRNYAAKRLIQDEFWIQFISIYYSAFTAILAILGLVGGKLNDFLDVPSVMFTVAVAILVIFANAQRCGARANDLSSNCDDLGERFSEVLSILNKSSPEQTKPSSQGVPLHNDELRKYMSQFYKNLGDSEEHSFVDEWKYQDYRMYYFY